MKTVCSSTMLVGPLAGERLSMFAGVTPCRGSIFTTLVASADVRAWFVKKLVRAG